MPFYFDFVSNNAYLAWSQLDKLSKDLNIKIEPRPVLFAGLLNAHGNVGPAEIPAKRMWMQKNILRKCAMQGVPMSPPCHHPFNPLMALRASCMDIDHELRWRLIDGFFKAIWVNGEHVSEPEVVASIARKAGLDERMVLEWVNSPEAANTLRKQTDEAVEKGVFGIPSMLIGDELFFGYDDFPFIKRYVRGTNPLDTTQLEKWSQASMSPSSIRAGRVKK